MEIHLIAKNELEAQGIQWMVTSHLTGVQLIPWNNVAEFQVGVINHQPDLIILDMDGWKDESQSIGEILQRKNIHWLGLSSERIFQTVYQALRFRAEDVLFRPFSPMDLIKQIQQLRYQLRNRQQNPSEQISENDEDLSVDYTDLFLSGRKYHTSYMIAAFLTPKSENLPVILDELEQYPFIGKYWTFALSDFILCVRETQENDVFQEECHGFLTRWKEMMVEPLAIIIKKATQEDSLKHTYQQTRQLIRRVFFEGYDIILTAEEEIIYQEMDPFLTPLEQRKWIEMLERRNIIDIREWMESEFLTFHEPYPDPEVIRVRLTSVLAQIRRYMKSRNIHTPSWESAYHHVFHQIVKSPIIYDIIQELIKFTTGLLTENHDSEQERKLELVEKARELIESNYWDAQWGLAACADTLRVNKSTLSRRFAAEARYSFQNTLHHVRIREAKRLLIETDLSLVDIARLSGYSHQTYFSAKFKQLEGCTPSAYRSGL
ncbi:response regulator transcription factor [Bacillus norwichensis]|uniref:Helix-turn-helix domain-containing protein n=1 Tax=Bacillus norwichensis TaxID=2762217 RepID=A0ABR8VIC9_9BACI|nr:response regulator transcription factor [Bacillus norwichensis]MBD8004361.1 helix-turn-helix domain-containing protein [Bacillus norwichensis]